MQPVPFTRTSRALRTTVVASAFGYTAQALSLVAIPLFLATVGTDGYGLMVTVMAFMGYLGFADAGLSWGSMILIAQAQGRDDKAGIAQIVRHSAVLAAGSGALVLLALAVILVAAAVGWRLPMFAGHPQADRLILIAGLQLALNLQFGIVYNLFQGLQEGYWTAVYSGLGRLVGLIGAMVAAWLTHSVAVMMGVQLAFTVLCGVAAAAHAWRRHRWAFAAGAWNDRQQYRAQLRIGAKNFMLQIGRTLSGTAPVLGISAILGPAMVPLYTVPNTLLTLCFMPFNSWSASMQSAYGEAWVAGARDWVRGAFRLSLERGLVLGGLGVALFFGLGDNFIRLWTHGRLWLDPAVAASIAAIVTFGALLTAGQYLLTGLNLHRRAAFAEIANGLLSLALVGLAVHWLGLGAVGLGVVGAALVTSAWVVWREIGAHVGAGSFPGWRMTLKVGLATAVSTITVLSVSVGEDGAVPMAVSRLAFGAVIGLAAYLAAALALKLVAAGDAVALARRLAQRVNPATP